MQQLFSATLLYLILFLYHTFSLFQLCSIPAAELSSFFAPSHRFRLEVPRSFVPQHASLTPTRAHRGPPSLGSQNTMILNTIHTTSFNQYQSPNHHSVNLFNKLPKCGMSQHVGGAFPCFLFPVRPIVPITTFAYKVSGYFSCSYLCSPSISTSEQAMATQTQAISLTARHARSEVVSESDLTPAPALPPISRRKQAAVLCSAFVTIALTIGYNQCFGVFQEYYLSSSQDVLVPSPASQVSPPTALLAFVGSLCYGLTWGGGILVNPVISRLEHGNWAPTPPLTRLWGRGIMHLLTPRTITISGVLMVAAGFTLASFSSSIWQLLLTQGFLVGLGMSLLYFPLLAPAPEYFTKHRATAMGVVSSPSVLLFLSSSDAAFYQITSFRLAW